MLSETEVYDAILDVYERSVSEGKDLVVEGSLLTTKILRQFKGKKEQIPGIETKALLFLFGLFNLHKSQIAMPGIDLNKVSKKERNNYLSDLKDALPFA